tara:strand:+ start:170 stop:352 length:183 start_codon:yes stop_codon:yes gene_type:complete
MKQILLILVVGLILTACSKSLSFGKKCVEKEEQVIWSYVWLYDKPSGLIADKHYCKSIAK